jgi:hypothetical protein
LVETVDRERQFTYGVAGTSHLLAIEARRRGLQSGIWVGDIVCRDGVFEWIRLPVKERILTLAGLPFYTPDDFDGPPPNTFDLVPTNVAAPDPVCTFCAPAAQHAITLLPYPVARMIAIFESEDQKATPLQTMFMPWNQIGYDYASESLFRTGVRPGDDHWPSTTLQGLSIDMLCLSVDGDSGRLPYLFACCGFESTVNASFVATKDDSRFVLARSLAKAKCPCEQWVPGDTGPIVFFVDGFLVWLKKLDSEEGCDGIPIRKPVPSSSASHRPLVGSGLLSSEKERLYARLGRRKIIPTYRLVRTSPCVVELTAAGSPVDGTTGTGPTEAAAREDAATRANLLLDLHEQASLAVNEASTSSVPPSAPKPVKAGATPSCSDVQSRPVGTSTGVVASRRTESASSSREVGRCNLVDIVDKRSLKLARALSRFGPDCLTTACDVLARFGFSWDRSIQWHTLATSQDKALISRTPLTPHGRVTQDLLERLERAYNHLDVDQLINDPSALSVYLENITGRVRLCDVDPTTLRGGDVALPLRLEDRDLHFAKVRDFYSTFAEVPLPFKGHRLSRGRHSLRVDVQVRSRVSLLSRLVQLLLVLVTFGMVFCWTRRSRVSIDLQIDCERGWCFPLDEEETAELLSHPRVTRLKSSAKKDQESMVEACRRDCCSTDIRSVQVGPLTMGDGYAFLPFANADCPSNNLRAAYNVVVNMDRTPPLLETALPKALVDEFARYKEHVGSDCDEHVPSIRESLSQAPTYTRRKCERVLTQEPQLVDVRFPYRDDIAPTLPELQTSKDAGPIFRFGAFIKMENANVVCEPSDSPHAKSTVGGQRYYPKKPKVRSIQALGIVQAVLMPLWDFLARVIYFIFTRRDAPVFSAVGALSSEISEWFTTAVARGFTRTVPLDGVGMDVRNKWAGRWTALKQLWRLFFVSPMPMWLSLAWLARLGGYWVEYAKCALRILINSLCSGEGDTTLANVIAQKKAVYSFITDETLPARFRARFGYDLPVPTFGELGYDGALASYPAVLVVMICGDDLLALLHSSLGLDEQEWLRGELIASYRKFGFEFEGPETQSFEHSSFLSSYFLATADDRNVYEMVPHVGRALSKMFTLSDLPRQYYETVPVDYLYSRLHAKLVSMWQAYAHVPILRDAIRRWAEQAASIAKSVGQLLYVPDDARARVFSGVRKDVDLACFVALYPSVFTSSSHVAICFSELLATDVWSPTMPSFVAQMALSDRDR